MRSPRCRGWFTWLQRERLLSHNPTAGVQMPRGEKRLPRHALSVREVETVLAQPDLTKPLGVRDRAMLETLYSTGLRRSELLALHLTDLDRERSLVLVRCGKGKKDRFIPIGERALAWIDKYLAEVRPQLAQGEGTPVLFLTSTPRRMSPNHLSALVRRYFEAAGLDYAGACHLFRHAAATLMEHGHGSLYARTGSARAEKGVFSSEMNDEAAVGQLGKGRSRFASCAQFLHEPSRSVGSSAKREAHALETCAAIVLLVQECGTVAALSRDLVPCVTIFLGILGYCAPRVVNHTDHVTLATLRPHHPETRKAVHG